MTRSRWKNRIKKMMVATGAYKPAFDSVIVMLAEILEQRDKTFQEFMDEGGGSCIEHTSDRGSVSRVKNPYLQMWCDLNKDALAYWRELGLTPSSLKKINEDMMKKPKISPLAEALRAIG